MDTLHDSEHGTHLLNALATDCDGHPCHPPIGLVFTIALGLVIWTFAIIGFISLFR